MSPRQEELAAKQLQAARNMSSMRQGSATRDYTKRSNSPIAPSFTERLLNAGPGAREPACAGTAPNVGTAMPSSREGILVGLGGQNVDGAGVAVVNKGQDLDPVKLGICLLVFMLCLRNGSLQMMTPVYGTSGF